MEKMTFEQANAKLEDTVKKMEEGNLSLSESMEQYSIACELLAFCMNELEACKGKITDINEKLESLSNGGIINEQD